MPTIFLVGLDIHNKRFAGSATVSQICCVSHISRRAEGDTWYHWDASSVQWPDIAEAKQKHQVCHT